VATGAVLASTGVGTAPTWSASPVVTDLKLGPSAVIGTSGVGVLALGASTVPTTSPVDTGQLYTADFQGEAGSRSLGIRDERGGQYGVGSMAAGITEIQLIRPNGIVKGYMALNDTGAYYGSNTNHSASFLAENTQRIQLGTDGNVYLIISGFTARAVLYGAPDSGGAGYRLMRVYNLIYLTGGDDGGKDEPY